MNYITFDKNIPDRCKPVKCVKNDPLTNISIHGDRFLLLILTSGTAKFSVNGECFTATAPCFVCFDEGNSPIMIEDDGIENYAIYFHPTFMNVNMTFERVHSENYSDIAYSYDMFLCKPFLEQIHEIRIPLAYFNRIKNSAEDIIFELEAQRDAYWSCRARSCFIEIMTVLEKIYGRNKALESELTDKLPARYIDGVMKAAQFIEANYNKDISYSDILSASGLSNADLTKGFKNTYEMTTFKYLYSFRIEIAKQQIAFTAVPLKDIALRNGFKTIQHFTRIFKEFTGETPSAYRKRSLEDRKNSFLC